MHCLFFCNSFMQNCFYISPFNPKASDKLDYVQFLKWGRWLFTCMFKWENWGLNIFLKVTKLLSSLARIWNQISFPNLNNNLTALLPHLRTYQLLPLYKVSWFMLILESKATWKNNCVLRSLLWNKNHSFTDKMNTDYFSGYSSNDHHSTNAI